MLILALFLTQKQNPFCREPRFVKAGRSCISIRTVWLENETTIKEILNSGPMIKRQLPGWYAKEAYWRLSWTLGTTFKTEAVELNPADWHKKTSSASTNLWKVLLQNIGNLTCDCSFRLFKVKNKDGWRLFSTACVFQRFSRKGSKKRSYQHSFILKHMAHKQ